MGRQKIKKDESLEFNKERLHKVLYAIVCLFVFALLLSSFGFILSTMIFIFFLVGVVEPQKWHIVLITTILVPLTSYVIFAVWLKVQMPKGFLGF
jgi:putative tricarboxylic transport membrane protein